jgi:putative cell wall-binding protein
VYLASGEGYADALSGAAIAAQRSAPLLLTRSASLPTFVADEFNRLSPRNIVILGGEASVKPEVVSRLQALLPTATITRIGGADRYAVSRNLVSDPTFGAKPSTELLVASGRVFPDALGAAPAAASHDAPVLLVDGTEKQFTPDELALIHSRGVRSITLLGGANTTSTSLEHSLDNDASSPSVRRIGGANRYDVASNVATAYFLDEAPNTAETVYLATGADFPDALAGAVIAKANNAPIFLTMRDCIPSATADVIDKLQSTHVVILGGKNSVSAAVETLAVCSP